jgi:hypothetical protein
MRWYSCVYSYVRVSGSTVKRDFCAQPQRLTPSFFSEMFQYR